MSRWLAAAILLSVSPGLGLLLGRAVMGGAPLWLALGVLLEVSVVVGWLVTAAVRHQDEEDARDLTGRKGGIR